MQFKSEILVLPGLGNSGEGHWQTLWEKQFGFRRVNQEEWETPVCEDWINKLDEEISRFQNDQNIILIGHSLACSTIVFWAEKYQKRIKGALLVAPSDTEADSYPPGTIGFKPMPMMRLPFPSITVASTNDPYVTLIRAQQFSEAWGSKLYVVADAGHINVASGYGPWPNGLKFLQELDLL